MRNDFSLAMNRPGVYFNDGKCSSSFQVKKGGTLSPAKLALIEKASKRFFRELEKIIEAEAR